MFIPSCLQSSLRSGARGGGGGGKGAPFPPPLHRYAGYLQSHTLHSPQLKTRIVPCPSHRPQVTRISQVRPANTHQNLVTRLQILKSRNFSDLQLRPCLYGGKLAWGPKAPPYPPYPLPPPPPAPQPGKPSFPTIAYKS